MIVPGMNAIAENPSILITCGLYCISKYMFMFSFAEPSAFRIRSACFHCLFFFAAGSTGWCIAVILFFLSADVSRVLHGLH